MQIPRKLDLDSAAVNVIICMRKPDWFSALHAPKFSKDRVKKTTNNAHNLKASEKSAFKTESALNPNVQQYSEINHINGSGII